MEPHSERLGEVGPVTIVRAGCAGDPGLRIVLSEFPLARQPRSATVRDEEKGT